MDLAVRGYSLCGVVWYMTLGVKILYKLKQTAGNNRRFWDKRVFDSSIVWLYCDLYWLPFFFLSVYPVVWLTVGAPLWILQPASSTSRGSRLSYRHDYNSYQLSYLGLIMVMNWPVFMFSLSIFRCANVILSSKVFGVLVALVVWWLAGPRRRRCCYCMRCVVTVPSILCLVFISRYDGFQFLENCATVWGRNSSVGRVMGSLSCFMQRGGFDLSLRRIFSGRADFSLGVNTCSDSIPPKLFRMRV